MPRASPNSVHNISTRNYILIIKVTFSVDSFSYIWYTQKRKNGKKKSLLWRTICKRNCEHLEHLLVLLTLVHSSGMQNTTYQIIPFKFPPVTSSVQSDERDSDAGAGYPSALGFNGNYNQPNGSVTRFSANCTVAAGAESSKNFFGQS